MRVPDAPIGSLILSVPDSMRVHRLELEGTLSTVRSHHLTDALVTTLTGAPITFKAGLHLGSFEISAELSFQDLFHGVGAVSPSPDLLHDSSNFTGQLAQHVKVLDYPEECSRVLELPQTYRHVLTLPDEPLSVTILISHRIDLKSGSSPSYVPSYRLPHSQRAVAHKLIDGMLKDGVIQESRSPWNSPVFLVPKKDGSYRPVSG